MGTTTWRIGGWRAWLAGAMAASALLGCGGGGGGGGGGGATIADTAAAYWVAGEGSRWVYQRVDGRTGHDPTPVLKTVVDAGEMVLGGVTVRRFEHSWSLFQNLPETEYRHFDGRQILTVADLTEDFGGTVTAQSYPEVPAPLLDGATLTVMDQSGQADLDGDGQPETLRFRVDERIDRVATLTVPAGDFREVLQVRQDVEMTVTVGATGQTFTGRTALTSWYAAGVGVIRRVYEDPEFAAPGNRVTEELVGLDAGGRRAGLLPGAVLLDGIGAGQDSGTPAAMALAHGGGLTMAIATQGGTLHGALRRSDGSLVWRGTVLQAPPGEEFATASVAHDGSEFRVVATHRRPYDSPTTWTVVAQRIDASGALAAGVPGIALDTGIADRTQGVWTLRTAARDGRLLVTWSRYDPSPVEVAPGLVTSRGAVLEGRVYDRLHLPVAPAFELADGHPVAAAAQGTRFIVVGEVGNADVSRLRGWAVGVADGRPVDAAGQLLADAASGRDAVRLQSRGDTLWASWTQYDSGTGAGHPTSLVVARLGSAGELLDGTPAMPGRRLVGPDTSARALAQVGLSASGNVLAWGEGWDRLWMTRFDDDVLTGTSTMPTAATPLVVGNPLGAWGGPSRTLLWAGAVDEGLLVAWLDNEQSGTAGSDRITGAWLRPRISLP